MHDAWKSLGLTPEEAEVAEKLIPDVLKDSVIKYDQGITRKRDLPTLLRDHRATIALVTGFTYGFWYAYLFYRFGVRPFARKRSFWTGRKLK